MGYVKLSLKTLVIFIFSTYAVGLEDGQEKLQNVKVRMSLTL